jgi:chromosome segregation ATPase
VIDSLLAPVRLPQRALESLDVLAEAARRLVRLEDAVLRHLESLDQQAGNISDDLAATREQVGSLHAHVTVLDRAVTRITDVVEHLDDRVAAVNSAMPRLEHEVTTTRQTVESLKAELKDLTDHLPDANSPGPITRAREAITGNQ